MKKKINLILILMAVCTACLLLFQFYWSYQAFQGASKTFKADINEALQAAVDKEMEHRQDKIAEAYKGWLADTNLVVINCHIDTTSGLTVFTVADKFPSKNGKVEFSLGFQDYKHEEGRMTTKVKRYFIDRLVDTEIRQNLQRGDTFYYTQRLGELMEEALQKSKLNQARLQLYFKEELLARDIDTDFRLRFTQDQVTASEDFPYTTRTYTFGFRKPFDQLNAFFPDPNKTLLLRMKWVLLSSLLLIGVTIFCFAYTVRTMLRQKKLSELKNDFVNNMTHELRTPVATISIAAEAIQEFNLSKESSNEYLGIIRQQSGRLSDLIDGILKSLVFEQDKLELQLTRVNLQHLLQQVITQHKPQLTQAQATVQTAFPEAPVYLAADALHLANVLSNLLENAVKYSTLTPQISISCALEHGQVVVRFSDNGIGIPANYRGKVFDKFFRVPTGNVHNTKGYGLGLSYAKTIIEKLGGTIALESQQLRGTTFIITLPTAPHEATERTFA